MFLKQVLAQEAKLRRQICKGKYVNFNCNSRCMHHVNVNLFARSELVFNIP